MLLNDSWIHREAVHNDLVKPFCDKSIRVVDKKPVISFGLSSFGYDVRLSHKTFKINVRESFFLDPKLGSRRIGYAFRKLERDTSPQGGEYFTLPAGYHALGTSIERLSLPRHVTGLVMGKSTYTRLGLVLNATPVEAGWSGHLTLSFYNSSCNSINVYAKEGIAQVLFFQGTPCQTSYEERDGGGKYQDSPEDVTFSKA